MVPNTSSATPRPWLLLCCLLVAVLAAYIPVLGAPLVWDDHHLIDESLLVQNLAPLPEYFGQGFWQPDGLNDDQTYYRPLSILSLALDKRVYGNNPGGFHFTNLGVHLLSTGLLYGLLRARRVPVYASLLGTAFWALFPRLTEAVAWISGRTDVLATFFVLAALLLQRRPTWPARMGTGLLLLLGLLCKEVALAGVASICILEYRALGTTRSRIARCAPAVLAFVSYSALRAHAVGLSLHESTLSFARRLVAAVATIGHYLVMLTTPWWPDIQIGMLDHPRAAFIALGVGVLILLPGLAIWQHRRLRSLSAEHLGDLVLVAFGFGLVLHVVSFSVSVLAADRFLYLPLLGLTLLSTSALAALDLPRSAGVLAALLVSSFGLVTFRRANIWSDEVSLWVASLAETQEDPSLSYIELGRVYSRAGLLAEALSIQSKGSSPRFDGHALAVENAGAVLARAGQYNDALRLLAPLARRNPNVPFFTLNSALLDYCLGHFAAARDRLTHALAVYPGNPAARALVLALPALEQKRRMLDALPEGAELLDRARLSAQLGLGAEAIAAWRRAVDRGGLSQSEFREGLWFTLEHGDAEAVASMCHAYSGAFASGRDPNLDLACETRADLVKRLRAAWPTLGL